VHLKVFQFLWHFYRIVEVYFYVVDIYIPKNLYRMHAHDLKTALAISHFDDLIQPFTADHFVANYWEDKPLIINRNDPGFYQKLFSIDHVDRVLDLNRPRGSSIRVVKNQEPLLPSKYENHDGSLNMNQLYAAYADGYTVVINEIERFWAPLQALCRNISAKLSHHTVANMYLTPKNEKALLPHYDTHDVYVLQIHGKKNWIIYDTQVEHPLLHSHQPVFQRNQLSNPQELTLEAGDLMYMPRGLPHEAYTTDESSLHITIGIYPAQWVDILSKTLEQMAYRDKNLRKALPPGFLHPEAWTPDFNKQFGETFQELLQSFSKQANPNEGIFSLSEELRNKQTPCSNGHFRHLDDVDQLSLASQLEKRPGMRCSVHIMGSFARIIFPGNIIKGPAQIADALQFIADAPVHFSVDDLPGLNENNKVQLAARLIRGGLLQFAK
jgi:ribosomal protein L16 Arg81 hydroxylase